MDGGEGKQRVFYCFLKHTDRLDLCTDTFERKPFVPVSTWLPRGYSLCRLDRAVMDLPGTSKTQPSTRATSKRRIQSNRRRATTHLKSRMRRVQIPYY